MASAKTVNAYFRVLKGEPRAIAFALRAHMDELWPHLTLGLAWGFPCYSANERILSIIAHKDRCNLQLFAGARLAPNFPDLIEGSGKMMRHVKVWDVAMLDGGVPDIIEAAVELDRTDPQKVR